MVTGHATIQNEAGIHCRPSTEILKAVGDYPGDMKVIAESGEADLRSMLGLMMLALSQGTRIDLAVDGPDEEAQLARLIALFETNWDFPDASTV